MQLETAPAAGNSQTVRGNHLDREVVRVSQIANRFAKHCDCRCKNCCAD